eukprot:3810303-Lingulodinium_polyedra.AAC.1
MLRAFNVKLGWNAAWCCSTALRCALRGLVAGGWWLYVTVNWLRGGRVPIGAMLFDCCLDDVQCCRVALR